MNQSDCSRLDLHFSPVRPALMAIPALIEQFDLEGTGVVEGRWRLEALLLPACIQGVCVCVYVLEVGSCFELSLLFSLFRFPQFFKITPFSVLLFIP